jgi:hypothetical protein
VLFPSALLLSPPSSSLLSVLFSVMISGEAWANIGAVQMKLKNWNRAYDALQEAQKHKSREWRILENLMMTTLEMRRSEQNPFPCSTPLCSS